MSERIAPVAVRRVVELALGLTVVAGAVGATPAQADAHLPPRPPAASLDWPTADTPALDWNPPAPLSPAPSTVAVPAPAAVVVQPGDSLWAIAAGHLPAHASAARVAQAWPQWWSANRAAVGSNPDLIHPGLSLTPPAQH